MTTYYFANSTGCLHLDIQSSITLRGAITRLLNQLRKNDNIDHSAHILSTLGKTRPQTTQATPTKTQRPITSQRVDHATSVRELEVDSQMERLRSQVARLEYENAKLKVDLQNRSID